MSIKTLFSWVIMVFLLISGTLTSCNKGKMKNEDNRQESYENTPFSTPKNVWKMPMALDEISGICWYGNNQLACVNDEQGVIFIYGLEEKKIIKQYKFGKSGDYEGIAYQPPFFYIMKSNGHLYQFHEDLEETVQFELPFNSKNDLEGLCMEDDQHLLVATKGRGGKEGKKKKYKGIYRVNLQDVSEVKLAYKIPNIDKEGPSGLAVDAISQKLYVLSHSSKELFILNMSSGEIDEVIDLKRKVFPQPEGICIAPDGRVFISNERADRYNATILEF